MKKVALIEYIENNIIRLDASGRGGGIEIDLSELLCKKNGNYTDKYEGYRMTAYQNYLGGGMLGSIQNDYSFNRDELSKIDNALVDKITLELNRYFHSLTNHEGDEWEETSFSECQTRPTSAY